MISSQESWSSVDGTDDDSEIGVILSNEELSWWELTLSLRGIISNADHRDHHANWILENTNISQVLADQLDKQIEQIEIIFPG